MKLSRSFVGLVLIHFLFAKAQAEYMTYKDPKQPINDRIKDLMNNMTLEEKIGQMVQIDRSVASSEVMRQYYIGSVLSGPGSVPVLRAPPNVWIDMVNSFQYGAMSTRLGIPMIYGIDAVHGNDNVYNATIFPHNIGLGCTRDPDLVKRIGIAIALEARATGIPYVFAPSVAVCRDPRRGRCYESFSEDPTVVKMLMEIIPGLQGDRPDETPAGIPYHIEKTSVAACAKHFVGDGRTTNDMDRDELFSIHLPGYSEAVSKGVSTVMVSHSSWNNVKMHANKELITGYLKENLGFMGFVISDWQGIDNITIPPHADYTYSVMTAVNAGIDMIMVPYNYLEFIDALTSLVNNKNVSMERIDDAVSRILRVKFELGLFENPFADFSLVEELGSQKHRELAREAVRKSLVLLKNGHPTEEPLIPLPKKADKILVAGTHADNLGYQCGGWTIEHQGFNGSDLTNGTTILSAINNTVMETQVVFHENPDVDFIQNGGFSYAIVVVGELPYAESAGDGPDLTLAEPGPETIINVCGKVKCVVVVVSGRPLQIEPYVEISNAVVAAWLPGSEGQGVADVLFGDHGFTGSLSMTWFKKVDQLPMHIGDEHYDPLWDIGFGIYTKAVKSA